MCDQRAAAVAAGANAAEDQRMLDQIEQIRRRPALAVEREKMAGEITTLIDSAARAAGVNSRRRISSEKPRRLGDSAYNEKPTQVIWESVTLKQVVDMVLALSSKGAGLNLESVRLSAPRDSADDLWTAELVLTYLIYEPQASKESPR